MHDHRPCGWERPDTAGRLYLIPGRMCDVYICVAPPDKRTVYIINPLRARNALRQHFRVILYTIESAS